MGASPNKRQIQKQQEKVIKKIVKFGPCDTWREAEIDFLWEEVVCWNAKELPKDWQKADYGEKCYIICECPYVKEFLEQKKWDVKSRIAAALETNEEADFVFGKDADAKPAGCIIEEVNDD